MPDAPPFTLRPLHRSDAEAVRALWSDRFGGAASTQTKWIEAALSASHSAVGLVATPAASDAIIGTSFLDVGRRAYTRRYLGLDVLDLEVPLADQNGLFHLCCVRADWENRGVGTAFYERRLDVLSARNVPRAFGIAWHRPAPVGSRALFEKYAFTPLATVDRFYDRTGTRPHCPVCLGAQCTCTASLYGRPVDA